MKKDKSGEKRSVIRPTETDIARDCNDSGQRQWTTTVDNDSGQRCDKRRRRAKGEGGQKEEGKSYCLL